MKNTKNIKNLRNLKLFDDLNNGQAGLSPDNNEGTQNINPNSGNSNNGLEPDSNVISTEDLSKFSKFIKILGLGGNETVNTVVEPEKKDEDKNKVEPENVEPEVNNIEELKKEVATLKDLQMDNQLLKLGVKEDTLDFVKFQISNGVVKSEDLNDYLSKNQHLLRSEIVSPEKNTEVKIITSNSNTRDILRERNLIK